MKAITFIILIPLIFISCQRQGELNRPADIVVSAFHAEPKRLNPVFLTDSVSYSISGLIFDGLTKIDDDFNVKGNLADSWQIRKGGLEIIFFLKKGVLWHDGWEFTSDDVIFTYKTVTSPNTATHHAEIFGPVKEVKAIDRYTVKVVYSKPFSTALESWSIGIIPKHLLEGKDINDFSFDKSPVGTGAYILKEWVPGQKLVFEAFKGFYGGKPQINKLIIKIIPEPSTRLMELKAGNIDLMELTPSQHAVQTDSLHIFNKYIGGQARYGFLGFNLTDPRFQNIKIREAISYAINKEAIINALFKGLGSTSTGPYPKNAWYFNPKAKYHEYNPKKAIRLLEESGWEKDKNNILKKDGMSFEFAIITNIEDRDNINIAQMIQEDLKNIGIRTEIKTFEWQTFRFYIVEKRKFEAVLMSRGYLWSPDIYDLWHSSRINEGEWNFLSYKNQKLDRLLEDSRLTIDIDRRKMLYHQIHEILSIDQPCIFLYNLEISFIAHKRITGIKPSPLGMLEDIHKWQIGG